MVHKSVAVLQLKHIINTVYTSNPISLCKL